MVDNPTVVVLGSLVLDMPVWLPRAPYNGETLKVQDGGIFPGGKGLNQAAGVLRLGGRPLLIGKVGRDAFGQRLVEGISQSGLDGSAILVSQTALTSYAIPVIEPNRQYIFHVPGANLDMTADDVKNSFDHWASAKILMVQGEISAEATMAAMVEMRSRGGLIILDPAPVHGITERMLAHADILTPNLQELRELAGVAVEDQDFPGVFRAVESLLSRFQNLRLVMATLGADGVIYGSRDGKWEHLLPPRVSAVDPTAAGDAFNGAFAWAVSEDRPWVDACRMGLVAGALAASCKGALPSLPHRKDFDELWTMYNR